MANKRKTQRILKNLAHVTRPTSTGSCERENLVTTLTPIDTPDATQREAPLFKVILQRPPRLLRVDRRPDASHEEVMKEWVDICTYANGVELQVGGSSAGNWFNLTIKHWVTFLKKYPPFSPRTFGKKKNEKKKAKTGKHTPWVDTVIDQIKHWQEFNNT
jgi:hypothetical protein